MIKDLNQSFISYNNGSTRFSKRKENTRPHANASAPGPVKSSALGPGPGFLVSWLFHAWVRMRPARYGFGAGASFSGCTGGMLLNVAFVGLGLGFFLGFRAGLHLLVDLLEAVGHGVDKVGGLVGGDNQSRHFVLGVVRAVLD